MKKEKIKCYICSSLMVILCILLDQYTKFLAVEHLKDKKSFVLIKDIFEFNYLENRGAAFGMLQNQKAFFIFSFILIITAVLYLYVKLPLSKRFLPLHICGILIVSGAIGNMIDRLRLGYVIDFFYFKLIDFPIFNVADIFVVVSVFLLAILILFVYKDKEINDIFSFKVNGRGMK